METAKQPQRRRNVIVLITALTVVLLSARLVPTWWHAAVVRYSDEALVTVSEQTTYILGPLRDDGYVDYIAAINEFATEGVTTENNAAVPLLAVVGCPACKDGDLEQKLIDALGVKRLPADSRYRPLDHFVNPHGAERRDGVAGQDLEAQPSIAQRRPWKAEEFPTTYGWIHANETALNKIVAATSLPRFQIPLIAAGTDLPLMLSVVPWLNDCREIGRALVTRAMLRAGNHQWPGAWSDLMACHRLGRLIQQGPLFLDYMVGMTIDGLAVRADITLLHYCPLETNQLEQFRQQLDQLARPPAPDSKMFGERLVCLDTLCGLARGRNDLEELLSVSAETSSVDFDEALRTCNATFDLMAQCCRLPSREAREEMQAHIDGQLAARINQARSTTGAVKQFVFGGRDSYSRNIADIVCTGLGPEVASCADAAAQQQLSLEMVNVALALAKYRIDHATYPDRLADLLPKYLAVIPRDPDSRGVILYTPEGEGYVLYSVGANRKDDAGDHIIDNTFRMPLSDTDAAR